MECYQPTKSHSSCIEELWEGEIVFWPTVFVPEQFEEEFQQTRTENTLMDFLEDINSRIRYFSEKKFSSSEFYETYLLTDRAWLYERNLRRLIRIVHKGFRSSPVISFHLDGTAIVKGIFWAVDDFSKTINERKEDLFYLPPTSIGFSVFYSRRKKSLSLYVPVFEGDSVHDVFCREKWIKWILPDSKCNGFDRISEIGHAFLSSVSTSLFRSIREGKMFIYVDMMEKNGLGRPLFRIYSKRMFSSLSSIPLPATFVLLFFVRVSEAPDNREHLIVEDKKP